MAFEFFLFEFFGVAFLCLLCEFFCFFAVSEFLVFECDFAVEFAEFADGFELGIHLGDCFDEGGTGEFECFFFFVAFAVEFALFFTLTLFLFFAFLLLALLFFFGGFFAELFFPDLVDEELVFGE